MRSPFYNSALSLLFITSLYYSSLLLRFITPLYYSALPPLFIYKAAQVWNKIIPKILNSPELDIGSGVVIPGSSVNSDLTTPIPFIENREKKIAL